VQPAADHDGVADHQHEVVRPTRSGRARSDQQAEHDQADGVSLHHQELGGLQQVRRIAQDAEQTEVEHDHEQRVVDIGLRALVPVDVVVAAGDEFGLAERITQRIALEGFADQAIRRAQAEIDGGPRRVEVREPGQDTELVRLVQRGADG
jgi:hypothetical protein